MATKIDELYARFMIDFVGELQSDAFYSYFTNMMKSGNNVMTLNEKYVERNVDLRWVEAIENTIIPLDTIIRNPNRYIKNIEEVVPIEMARTISTESVRHLATHTNLIAQVDGDDITPHHILNVIKEESFDTYENRFIFTLLFKLEYFLDKRMQVLLADKKVADNYEMCFSGNCSAGNDEIDYDVKMNYKTPHVDLDETALEATADVTHLTAMQRIERLRKILYSFKESALIKALKGCAMVRPPLTMTNVLTKNPNFRKCVDLWGFIETYYDVGFTVNMVERNAPPSPQFLNDMFSLMTLQYVVMKKNTLHVDELGAYDERKKETQPNVVKKSIQDIIETYDLDIDEFKRVFIDQIERKKKKIKAEFTKVKDIVKRAIATDKEFLAKQTALRAQRIAREQAKMREEERLEQPRLEQERLAQERLEQERLERERLEQERLEQERLEQERLEREIMAKEAEAAEKALIKALQELEEREKEQNSDIEIQVEEAVIESEESAEETDEAAEEVEESAEETKEKEESEAENLESSLQSSTSKPIAKVTKWFKDKLGGLFSKINPRKKEEQTEEESDFVAEEIIDETSFELDDEAEETTIVESHELDETIINDDLAEKVELESEEYAEAIDESENNSDFIEEVVSSEKEKKSFPRKKNRRRNRKRGLPKITK